MNRAESYLNAYAELRKVYIVVTCTTAVITMITEVACSNMMCEKKIKRHRGKFFFETHLIIRVRPTGVNWTT